MGSSTTNNPTIAPPTTNTPTTAPPTTNIPTESPTWASLEGTPNRCSYSKQDCCVADSECLWREDVCNGVGTDCCIQKPSTTQQPTYDPTMERNELSIPFVMPSSDPTSIPTTNPIPTKKPTLNPTRDPTDNPTLDPTNEPTPAPSPQPTRTPTDDPTSDPTDNPTEEPTDNPTLDPTPDPTEEITDDRCQCDGGLMSVNLKYTGEGDAEYIRIYVKDNDKYVKRRHCVNIKMLKMEMNYFVILEKQRFWWVFCILI